MDLEESFAKLGRLVAEIPDQELWKEARKLLSEIQMAVIKTKPIADTFRFREKIDPEVKQISDIIKKLGNN